MNRAKIEDTLLKISVPAGIKGFNYISDALEIFDERGFNISITRELYPAIAEKNNTTAPRVERAIRHAFETVRSYKGNPEVINHYIGMDNCENSSSLKTLYIRIRQECEDEKEKECGGQNLNWENETPMTASEIREIIQQELESFLNELKAVRT